MPSPARGDRRLCSRAVGGRPACRGRRRVCVCCHCHGAHASKRRGVILQDAVHRSVPSACLVPRPPCWRRGYARMWSADAAAPEGAEADVAAGRGAIPAPRERTAGACEPAAAGACRSCIPGRGSQCERWGRAGATATAGGAGAIRTAFSASGGGGQGRQQRRGRGGMLRIYSDDVKFMELKIGI